MNLGIAFQLVDDALDYGGKAAKLGKNVGDDFREGKITLPVVLSFRRGSESERAFWRRTLEDGDATDADLEHAIGADDQAPRARGHDPARAPLRRHRHATRWRCFPASPMKAGAGRDGRVLHLPLELAQPVGQRRAVGCAGAPGRPTARLPAPSRAPTIAGSRPATFAAAAAAAASVGNRPKQVAPEPDMRASRQSGSACSTARTFGDHGLQLDGRRLEIVAILGQRSDKRGAARLASLPTQAGWDGSAAAAAGEARFSAANTSLVETATPGLTSTASSRGRSSGADRTSPMPRIRRGLRIEADRHIGAGRLRRLHQAGIVERNAVGARQKAQSRRRVRRAAAQSGRDRQALRQREAAERETCDPLGERAGGLEHEIVGTVAGGSRGRPADRERQARRRARTSKRRPTPAKATRLSSS